MSNRETPKGAHTMGGDGEPTMPTRVRFKASMMIDETGAPVLVFEAGNPNDESISVYVIKGDDLFNFYAMVKRGLEGEQKKRPSYLG